MRRVITTTLYFDYEDVPDSSNVTEAPLKVHLPDISFSWFNGNVLAPLDTNGIDFFTARQFPKERIRSSIEWLLRDSNPQSPRYLFDIIDSSAEFIPQKDGEWSRIHDTVMDAPVVIEQSPPISLPFKDLLNKSNSEILLGTYVGMAAGGQHDTVLLLLTVPGGILVVSSAAGIARALQKGFMRTINKLFTKNQ